MASFDPIDLLKERFSDLKDDLKSLIQSHNTLTVAVAKIQGQIKIIYFLITAIVSGIISMFFYNLRG